MAKPGIARTVGDQCQYGQTAADGRPVKKATGWLSNAPAILEELSLRCTGREGRCSGGRKTHAAASGRVAREAAVYPFRLCRAILVGLRKHLIQQGKIAPGIHGCQTRFEEQDPAVSARGWVNACVTREVVYRDAITGELLPPELLDATRKLFSDDDPTDEINAVTKQETTYKDAVTGQPLQKALVETARKLELEYFASKQVGPRGHTARQWLALARSPSVFAGLILTRATTKNAITDLALLPGRFGSTGRTPSSLPLLRWRV